MAEYNSLSKINLQIIQAAQNRHETREGATSGSLFVVSSTLKAFGEHELWRGVVGNLTTPPWLESGLPHGLLSDFGALLVGGNEDVALDVSPSSSRQKVNELTKRPRHLSGNRTVSCT